MACLHFLPLIIDSRNLSAEMHNLSKLSMSGFQARSDCYMADLCDIELVMAESQRHCRASRSLYLQIPSFTLLPSQSAKSDSDCKV